VTRKWLQSADVDIDEAGALLVRTAEPDPAPVTLPAVINYSTTGDKTVIAAVADQRIVVTGALVVCGAAVTLTFKSGSTAITGPMTFAAGGGFGRDARPDSYLFRTEAGQALVLNLSADAAVGGCLTYYLE